MDQNKGKASWEKRDAEQKIVSNDYTGAMDNLLRAQQHFPGIENIGSMLTVCDILSAANI